MTSNVLTSADAQAGRVELAQMAELIPHAKRQLKALGYTYLDEIMALTGAELREKLQGPAVLRSVLGALGRAEEAEQILRDLLVLRDPVTGKEVGSVPRGTLRQIAALQGTARALSFESPAALRHALEVGQRLDPSTGQSVPFTWEDLARYRLSTLKINEGQARAGLERAVVAGGGPSLKVLDEIEGLIEERVKQYQEDFDVTAWTSSDFAQLRALAAAEIRLAALQKAQLGAFSGSKEAEQANKVRTEEAERLVNIIQKLRADLQISLKARAEAKASTQADQVITQLATRGKQLMRERMSFAQHCGVLIALIYPMFPDALVHEMIRVRCPRCGEEFDWQAVTPLMLERYTAAGNFLPPDAPPGLFDRT